MVLSCGDFPFPLALVKESQKCHSFVKLLCLKPPLSVLTWENGDALMMGCVCVVSRFKARPEEGAVHLHEEERQEGSEGSTAGRISGRDVCLPSWRGTVNSMSSTHVTQCIESHYNNWRDK